MYYLPELYANICTKKCMLCVEMAFTDFRLCAQFHCKKKIVVQYLLFIHI